MKYATAEHLPRIFHTLLGEPYVEHGWHQVRSLNDVQRRVLPPPLPTGPRGMTSNRAEPPDFLGFFAVTATVILIHSPASQQAFSAANGNQLWQT